MNSVKPQKELEKTDKGTIDNVRIKNVVNDSSIKRYLHVT